jgi:hypothetical protein
MVAPLVTVGGAPLGWRAVPVTPPPWCQGPSRVWCRDSAEAACLPVRRQRDDITCDPLTADLDIAARLPQ